MPWALPPTPPAALPSSGSLGGGFTPDDDSDQPIGATGSSGRADPYGTDLAITSRGDLTLTPAGGLGLIAGPDNCAQAVYMRLKTPLGDLALHAEYGSQATEQIGSKLNAVSHVAALNADLRTLLLDDPRFTGAQITQVQQPANTGQADSILLGVQATLFGGEQLTLGSLSDPSPSDVTLPLTGDVTPLDPTVLLDPMSSAEFFADQPELDDLNDLNSLQSLVDDFPPGG